MTHRPEALSQWFTEVSTHMPHMGKRQAMELALYSFGMALTGRCGVSSIVCFRSVLLGKRENTLWQRLREVTYEAERRGGAQRGPE